MKFYLKLRFVTCTIFSLMLPIVAFCQQADSARFGFANIFTVHSKILNQDRKLYIYVPVNLTNDALPVIYLLDGDSETALVSAEMDYLINDGSMPKAIVVGIGNYNYDRYHDLTPTHSATNSHGKLVPEYATSGGGDVFLNFIKNEVMLFVEHNYKTCNYKVLSGHSLGGLMAVHCLLTQPDMFDAYLAISPAVWWANSLELTQTAKLLKPAYNKPKFVFVSDANEGGSFHQTIKYLDSLLINGHPRNLTYKYASYPDESHGTEPIKANYDGLRYIFSGWVLQPADTTLATTMAFYKRLSARTGLVMLPPENLINGLGYHLMEDAKRIDDAIAAFSVNVANYPNSYNVYDSLGDAYAKKGDKNTAINSYQKALVIDPKNEDTAKKLKALRDKK